MDKNQLFELYEILALILPGSVLLFGISKLYPQLMLFSFDKDFSAGQFGVFVLLAYAVGHIVQVFGGWVEFIWRNLREEPMDWFQKGKKPLLFDGQLTNFEQKVSKLLDMPQDNFHLTTLSRKEWLTMIKQMQIAVEIAGRTGRLDKFQAIYMMCRGLIATLLLLSFAAAFSLPISYWYIPFLLLFFALILFYRMTRFERSSVRELFIQFLQLPTTPKDK